MQRERRELVGLRLDPQCRAPGRGGEELQRALAAAGDVRPVGGDGDAAAGVEAAEALGLGEGLELVGGHRGAVWELRATLTPRRRPRRR